ncbi:hypothetical protein ACOSQ3_016043 [Xanthoceras sorbifolium]
MEGFFVFAAKPTLASSEELKKKPPDTLSHSKCCRVDDGDRDEVVELQKSIGESFKSKLVGVANPASWAGFGSKKEKLKLEESDVSVTLDSNGMLINLLKDRNGRYRNGRRPINRGYYEAGFGGIHNVENLGNINFCGDCFFSGKNSGASSGVKVKLGSRPGAGSFIGSDIGASSSGGKVEVDYCVDKAGSGGSKAGIGFSGGKAGVVSSGGKIGLASGSDRVEFDSSCVRMGSRFTVLVEQVMRRRCKNVSNGKKEAKSKGKDKDLSKGMISNEDVAGQTVVDVIEENDTLKLLYRSMLDSSIGQRMTLGDEDSCMDSPQQASESCSSVDRRVMTSLSSSGDGFGGTHKQKIDAKLTASLSARAKLRPRLLVASGRLIPSPEIQLLLLLLPLLTLAPTADRIISLVDNALPEHPDWDESFKSSDPLPHRLHLSLNQLPNRLTQDWLSIWLELDVGYGRIGAVLEWLQFDSTSSYFSMISDDQDNSRETLSFHRSSLVPIDLVLVYLALIDPVSESTDRAGRVSKEDPCCYVRERAQAVDEPEVGEVGSSFERSAGWMLLIIAGDAHRTAGGRSNHNHKVKVRGPGFLKKPTQCFVVGSKCGCSLKFLVDKADYVGVVGLRLVLVRSRQTPNPAL